MYMYLYYCVQYCTFYFQFRREFRELTGVTGRVTALMDSWPGWEDKIVAFSKIEAPTRRNIQSLRDQLDVEHDDEIVAASGLLCILVADTVSPQK